MHIHRISLQDKMPNNKHIAWAEPLDSEKINLKIYKDKKWIPIAGSGNNTTVTKYTSDPNAPMLTTDNFYSIFESKAEELGINSNTLTEEQVPQLVSSMNSVKFATPKQGNAILVDFDLDNGPTFQCDDGSYITLTDGAFVGLRPDLDGYIIWKTTIDKLPVRESQEETDPEEPNPGGSPKSAKSGSSLKASGGGSTGEVYTVINNNTGEIVDPLELHKLTNVIWYDYFGKYYPFYLNGVEDFNTHKDGIYSNLDHISNWVGMISGDLYFTYLTVYLFYNYTLRPGTVCSIQTTSNNTVTDINKLFE